MMDDPRRYQPDQAPDSSRPLQGGENAQDIEEPYRSAVSNKRSSGKRR